MTERKVHFMNGMLLVGTKEEIMKEVAPPGWGHTKAEKEKTDPSKPKSKPQPKPKAQKPLTDKEKAQREVDAQYGRTPWNPRGSLGT